MNPSNRCRWFATPPLIPLFPRGLIVAGSLLLTIWGNDVRLMLTGVLGALVFRRLCCHDLHGIARELWASMLFSLVLAALAVPSFHGDLLQFGINNALRVFLFLSPSATFARCLYPREALCALQGILPSGLFLSFEIALRFLPLLVREGMDVFRIQYRRGAFGRGAWIVRLQALLFPFFSRLFGMADRVTFSLQARGIDPTRSRALVPPEIIRQLITEGEMTMSKELEPLQRPEGS